MLIGSEFRRLVAPFAVRRRTGAASAMLLLAPLTQQALAQSAIKPAARPAPAAAPAPPAAEPPTGSVSGMGDVNLYPKRVVIDQKQRVASVGLFNRAAAQGEYEITVSDMMMTPEGRLVELGTITDAAARDKVRTASRFLRWSPRRVTLGSHDSQTVRIMARVPPELPPGEYRSHFSAIAVPNQAAGGFSIEEARNGGQKPGTIGVTIVPRFGISIPVIVRVGETTLTTGLRNLTVTTLPDGGRAVSLTITREGTRSAFGDIAVTVTGTRTKVADVRGIGVYTEVGQRAVQIAVDPAADPRLTARGAKLTVTYTDDDFAPGKILARQDFTVP